MQYIVIQYINHAKYKEIYQIIDSINEYLKMCFISVFVLSVVLSAIYYYFQDYLGYQCNSLMCIQLFAINN